MGSDFRPDYNSKDPYANAADEYSIRLQLFSKCSFNPMSVIGYDVG